MPSGGALCRTHILPQKPWEGENPPLSFLAVSWIFLSQLRVYWDICDFITTPSQVLLSNKVSANQPPACLAAW